MCASVHVEKFLDISTWEGVQFSTAQRGRNRVGVRWWRNLPPRCIFSIYYVQVVDKFILMLYKQLLCISCPMEEYPAFGELQMRNIPSALHSHFVACLRSMGIPNNAHASHLKWLRY